MVTYQDYLEAADVAEFVGRAIGRHMAGAAYRTAVDADLYDRQRNVTINSYRTG